MVVGLEKVVFKEECLSDSTPKLKTNMVKIKNVRRFPNVRRTDENMKMFEIRNMATEAGISGHTIAKTKNDLIQFILNSKESKKKCRIIIHLFLARDRKMNY